MSEVYVPKTIQRRQNHGEPVKSKGLQLDVFAPSLCLCQSAPSRPLYIGIGGLMVGGFFFDSALGWSWMIRPDMASR